MDEGRRSKKHIIPKRGKKQEGVIPMMQSTVECMVVIVGREDWFFYCDTLLPAVGDLTNEFWSLMSLDPARAGDTRGCSSLHPCLIRVPNIIVKSPTLLPRLRTNHHKLFIKQSHKSEKLYCYSAVLTIV